MPKIDIRQWLGAHAAGTLSPAEERKLYEAALNDQDLFNELGEESLLREALTDEEFRRKLKRRLRELDSSSSRAGVAGLMDWIKRPEMALAACLAVVALVFGVGPLFRSGTDTGTVAGGDPSGEDLDRFNTFAPPSPDERLDIDVPEWLWDISTPGQHAGVELELDREGDPAQYELGEIIRIEFSVPEDSEVFLLRQDPSGTVVLLFPNGRRAPPFVQAGEQVEVSTVGQGEVDPSGPSVLHRLRLFVFPPGTDPLASAPETQGRPLVEERSYLVATSR